MSDQVNAEHEETERSGLLLSVEPLVPPTHLSAHPGDDTDAADAGDKSDATGVDSDKKDAADTDATDKKGDSDGTDSDGTDDVGDDTDGTDSSADADSSDA